MTQQYKTGVWYAHNGEPKPAIHDKTTVRALAESWTGEGMVTPAGDVDWINFKGAFQIVTPYIEPREFIVTIAKNGDMSVHRADNPPTIRSPYSEYVAVREVV